MGVTQRDRMNYTLTTLINTILDNHRYNEYELDSENNTLIFKITSSGDSIDYWNETSEEWEEDCMIYQNNYPLEDDEDTSELDNGSPMRTHGYSSCYREYYLTLPPNRKRGDTYTITEIRKMIGSVDNHQDIPGMGFDYYNLPEDWEDG